MQNKSQSSVDISKGIIEIVNRHGENTREGDILWDKDFGWDNEGSTAYNAEEECRKEIEAFLTVALDGHKKEILTKIVSQLPVKEECDIGLLIVEHTGKLEP